MPTTFKKRGESNLSNLHGPTTATEITTKKQL